jgi:hypothetical protein
LERHHLVGHDLFSKRSLAPKELVENYEKPIDTLSITVQSPGSGNRMEPTVIRRSGLFLCVSMILAFGPSSTVTGASQNSASILVPPASVLAAVKAAQSIVSLNANVTPSLQLLASSTPDSVDWGGDVQDGTKCVSPTPTNAYSENYHNCFFGDVHSKITVALLGDSRASMVLDDMNYLGIHEGFRVLYVAKSGCPTPTALYTANSSSTLWTACIKFHATMLSTMAVVKPQVIVISTSFLGDVAVPTPHWATPTDIATGLASFLSKLPKASKTYVLGGFPQPGATINPVICLTRNMTNVQACAFTVPHESLQEISASRSATLKEHDTFLNLYPYFCASTCPAVINNIIPYTADGYHAGKTYMTYLMGTVWSMLKPALAVAK